MLAIALTIIRQAITAYGAVYVANGMLTQDQVTQVGGAAAIVLSFAWSLISQKLAKRKAVK